MAAKNRFPVILFYLLYATFKYIAMGIRLYGVDIQVGLNSYSCYEMCLHMIHSAFFSQ